MQVNQTEIIRFLMNEMDPSEKISFEKKSKINIGYFSSDFYDHATLRLMMDVFQHHDRSKFNIFGFAYGPKKDDSYTKKLKTYLCVKKTE